MQYSDTTGGFVYFGYMFNSVKSLAVVLNVT